VAGQIHAEPGLNDQLARLPDLVPFTGVAGSDGLRVMDRWHFDAESMRQLGRRYAEALRRIQERSTGMNSRSRVLPSGSRS
jgi:hypothetical protein